MDTIEITLVKISGRSELKDTYETRKVLIRYTELGEEKHTVTSITVHKDDDEDSKMIKATRKANLILDI